MSDNKDFVPYESTHRLRPLYFVTTVVNENQSEYIVNLNREEEAAVCFVCHGKGTAPKEALQLLRQATKKEVVFSVLRADRWPSYKEKLDQRFSVSKMAKGIAYAVPMDSIAGVSIYKMLSNTRLFEKPVPVKKKGRK